MHFLKTTYAISIEVVYRPLADVEEDDTEKKIDGLLHSSSAR